MFFGREYDIGEVFLVETHRDTIQKRIVEAVNVEQNLRSPSPTAVKYIFKSTLLDEYDTK